MARTIGIGIIGMGWMGLLHSRSYRQVYDRFSEAGIRPRLVICADEVESRARQAQDLVGFESYSTNWRDVVNDPEVEVVNVTTSNNMHLACSRAAAEAGKHILCEKPVGRYPEETAQAEHAARKAGVMSFVGFCYRWTPLIQYARNLIQEGHLGEITLFRGRFLSSYGANPNASLTWRFDERISGLGTLGDQMSHLADMAQMLAGPIARVAANTHTFTTKRPVPKEVGNSPFLVGSAADPTADVTNEDYASAIVEFASGARGTLESCRTVHVPRTEFAFDIHGTKGTLRWNFARMNEIELYLPDSSGAHDGFTTISAGPQHPAHGNFGPNATICLGYNDLKVIEAYQFLNSIVTGKQSAPSLADGLLTANVLAALTRSQANGGWEDVKSLRIE